MTRRRALLPARWTVCTFLAAMVVLIVLSGCATWTPKPGDVLVHVVDPADLDRHYRAAGGTTKRAHEFTEWSKSPCEITITTASLYAFPHEYRHCVEPFWHGGG